MKFITSTLLLATVALSAPLKAITYDATTSLTNNLLKYRTHVDRDLRSCLVVGINELNQLLSIKVDLSGCRVASEGEPEYSTVLKALHDNGQHDAIPVSPIPEYNEIADLLSGIIGKKQGKLTILSSPATQFLASDLANSIKQETSYSVDVQVPSRMQDLPKVFKRINGDAVLMLHDPTIFRNPKQVRSFMELMIANSTPVVGVSPYFKELGGLIEISKPPITTYQEAISANHPDAIKTTIEYWDTIPKIFGLTKDLQR